MSASRLDPQQALAATRRSLSRAPDQLADGVTRVVRGVPDAQLERLMRSPARRIVLDGIFWQMSKQIDRTRAVGTTASICWRITGRPDGGADTYQLEIADGRCRVIREPAALDARVTITVDGVELLRLASGSLSPMQAYFDGRIAITGNIMVAAKLASVFRIPVSGSGAPERPSQAAA